MEKKNGHSAEQELQQAYRAAYLVAGHIKQTLTEEEQEELDDWILASKDNMRLFGELTNEKNIAASLARFEKMQVEEDLQTTKKHLSFNQPRKSNRLWQYAIAASVIITVGIYIYITAFSGKKVKNIIAVQTTDINPGSDKAILTLENGQKIVLESGTDTNINAQIKLLRKEGEVVYTGVPAEQEVKYHVLTVPRKGQYKLTLPDGTKVWLNAASSIQFPTSFAGNERKVVVTGETFFEVAKDATKPFRAVAGETTIEALGTQFNINAYSNEPFLAATLTEGSVLVSKGKDENILQPGQQAQLSGDNFNIVKVNPAEVTGWKSSEFVFVNTSLESILRQVERWYDADVIYEDKIDVHLNATIERDVPVSKLLHILEQTGHVHFKVEGKKITVRK